MDAVAHLQHFALKRDPFANDASLAQVQETPPFADAGRRLRRAVAQERGLCVLTGAGGSGKTLLVRALLDALEEEVHEACMLVPVPGVSDGPWVLDRFARQLGVEAPEAGAAALVGQLYEQLAIVREDGRHTVLFVDEAQVLADRGALGELRGLLNLEYEDRRLLTLVLAGLPHLGEAVARDPALAGRVDVRVRLGALAPEAVGRYVANRLRAADAGPGLFEEEAVQALASLGGGLPRRINTLADGALFEAFLAGRARVARPDVERAASEIEEDAEAAPAAPRPAPAPAERPRPAARAPEPEARAPRGPEDDAFSGAGLAGEAGAAAPRPAPRPEPEPDAPVRDAPFDAETDLDLEGEVVADETDPPADGEATEAVALVPDDGPPKEDELDDLFADLVEEP